MKSLQCLLMMLIGFTSAGCNDGCNSQSRGASGVYYDYTAYDFANHAFIQGSLTFDAPLVEGNFAGSWHLQRTSSSTTAPVGGIAQQTGSGRFKGSLHSGNIELNFNPNVADDNVMLEGDLQNNQMHGQWDFCTYAGGKADGRFVIAPHKP